MTKAKRVLPDHDDFIRLPALEMSALVRQNIRTKVSWRHKLKLIAMLGRPRTGIHALLCFMLGLSFAGYENTPVWAIILGAGIYFVWASVLANLENNYADLEEDCHNVPGRVYLVAQRGYDNLLLDIIVLNLLLLMGAAFLGFVSFMFMLLALLVPHQYSFGPLRAKARPWWCLVIMAQLVVFPFIAGIILGQANNNNFTSAPRCLAMIIFLNLWFIAKAMFKNVPDFAGDKAAGLLTSATLCATRKRAAIIATLTEISAYASLAALVISGLEQPRLLFALFWIAPILWNCMRLIQSEGMAQNNQCLKFNALCGAGFMASVLLLIFPKFGSIMSVAVVIGIIFASEAWLLDARRDEHLHKI